MSSNTIKIPMDWVLKISLDLDWFQCHLTAIIKTDANQKSIWQECSVIKTTVLTVLNGKRAW